MWDSAVTKEAVVTKEAEEREGPEAAEGRGGKGNDALKSPSSPAMEWTERRENRSLSSGEATERVRLTVRRTGGRASGASAREQREEERGVGFGPRRVQKESSTRKENVPPEWKISSPNPVSDQVSPSPSEEGGGAWTRTGEVGGS